MAVVQAQHQGRGHLDQCAQPAGRRGELRVRFAAEAEANVVARKAAQLSEHVFHRPGGGFAVEVIAEVMVDRIGAQLLARLELEDEEVATELVELAAVTVAESDLDRPPVIVIQAGLQFVVEAHQHEVADQVGLRQIQPGGVEALEDHLRVVVPARQADIHDHQLGDPGIDLAPRRPRQAGPGRKRSSRAPSRLRHPESDCPASSADSASLSARRSISLLLAFALAVAVAQEAVFHLFGRRQGLVVGGVGLQAIAQRGEQQGDSGQPLLPVDHQPAREWRPDCLRRRCRRPNPENAPLHWDRRPPAGCRSTVAGSAWCPRSSRAGRSAR
jgi:hypothetical protein